MGGWVDTHEFHHTNEKKINEELGRLREEDLHENGHDSYTGSWGQSWGKVQFVGRHFDTADEAMTWLDCNTEKRGRVLGVTFSIPAEMTKRQKAKADRLHKKYREAEDKHNETVRKIRATFWDRKSKTIGCAECGSKLSRTHMAKRCGTYAHPQCPVCSATLLSKTDQDRIARSKVKVQKAYTAWEKAVRDKPSKKKGTMIGFYAAS